MILSGEARAPTAPAGEALLFSAARIDHIDETIAPALARGDWVVCDRFAEFDPRLSGRGGPARRRVHRQPRADRRRRDATRSDPDPRSAGRAGPRARRQAPRRASDARSLRGRGARVPPRRCAAAFLEIARRGARALRRDRRERGARTRSPRRSGTSSADACADFLPCAGDARHEQGRRPEPTPESDAVRGRAASADGGAARRPCAPPRPKCSRAYRDGRLAHAWLIGGREGIGKATLAWRFARFVLAHPDPDVASGARGARSLDAARSSRGAATRRDGASRFRAAEAELEPEAKNFFNEIRVEDVRARPRGVSTCRRRSAAGASRSSTAPTISTAPAPTRC